ncbi:MAG: dethiobiotin synthase [Succinivibrio dextrinosolvens]|nr:dethiobiotin synthase [Succinivibrio dextrinosolvens]
MRGLFVTGTGTDIGKTYVSAAIARELTKKNLSIAYYKAAVSGSDSIEHSDAGFVRDSSRIKQNTESLLSYLYEKPLSPHLAARGENRFASLDKILKDFNSLRGNYDYVLSEGAGGIICPVVWEKNDHLMYLDILKALKLNAVVVADAGLGTINHTVLTISYLKQNSIKVKGVILNNFDNSSVMHSDNLQMIEEISGTNVIATLGKGDKKLNLRYQKMEDYFDEC